MDTYTVTYSGYSDVSSTSGAAGFGAGFLIVWLAICILLLVSMFKIWKKAGKSPIRAIIPILNIIDMYDIAGLGIVYILLLFVPIANIYSMIKCYAGLSKRFGKSTGFTVGLILLPFIFFPMLAFGKDTPAAATTTDTVTPVAPEAPVANVDVTAPVNTTVAPEVTPEVAPVEATGFGTTTNEGVVGNPSVEFEAASAPVVEQPAQAPTEVQPVSAMFDSAATPVQNAEPTSQGDPTAPGAIEQPTVNPFAPAQENGAAPVQNTDNTQM